MNRKTAGYSLIEVLVAIAITSVVLLTIVTLFYVGKRNVYAGKERSYAVAAGTRIMEDLSAMTAEDVQHAFNLDDNTDLSNAVTLDGLPPGSQGTNGSGQIVVNNSVLRDSSACTWSAGWTCTNDTDKYMANWMTEIAASGNTSEKLANPVIGIIITPRTPTDNAKKVTTAQFTKIRVFIRWDEAGASSAHRYAIFDTSKVSR
jgi:prepilin-type N-terminal cleavage/methylation domain-containing protein